MLITKYKKLFLYVVSAIVILIVILIFCLDAFTKSKLRNTPSNEAAAMIDRNQEFYAKHLRHMMSREEALSYFPAPQNTNTRNVCVWVYNSAATIPSRDDFDWRSLQATRSGFFIVFTNNKLVTPLCANAAFNPSQALQFYAGLTEEQANEILAPSHKE